MSGLERPVVDVRVASKHYGPVRAVDGVSLEVAAGEIYALLGLNGAGKTTLIRMMLSMVHPSSGSIQLMGRSLGSPSVWADVGYLVETPSAYPELTVRENLEIMRRLRRLPDTAAVDDAIARFGLGPYAHRRARTLSLGNLQRLGLAKAMLHRPSLVVLDEPVNGLDPAGVVEIRTLLSGLAREHGMTVFLSSHLLGEVARLASRVGVLHQGRLVDELTPSDLAHRVGRHLVVATRDNARALMVLASAGLSASATGSDLRLTSRWAVQNPDAVATTLVRGGCPPMRLAVTEEDLESYFLGLVGAATTDEPVQVVHRAG
jgi:ABC-2 type transport system ATP-binding protein